jgi:hypothetical protein
MQRERRNGIALLTATAAWALAMALSGSTDVLLYLAPALLVAVPLMLGRYPGERALERLRRTDTAPRPRPVRITRPGRRTAASLLPRGGSLIAVGLARRGPPLPLAA